MKKRTFGKKLSRGSGARKALYRSLTRALVDNGSITTTKAKAKSIIPFVEKIINVAKKDTFNARRQVYAKLGNDRKTTDELFKHLVPNFNKRNSGFLKITPLPRRKGDNAEIVRLEWVEKIVKSEKKSKDSKNVKSKSSPKDKNKVKKEKK